MSIFLLDSPKCVFIHIPKTGGATIRRGIFEAKYQGPVFGKVPNEWMPFFKFAFIRNPYDRLISAWKMFIQGMTNSIWKRPDDMPNSCFLSLADFLEIVTDESIAYGAERRTYKEIIRHHTIPQTHPFNCLGHANFVGRFERFEEDLGTIFEKLGLPLLQIPHWNKTTHDHYTSYYDEKTRAISREFYREDLDSLGYEF